MQGGPRKHLLDAPLVFEDANLEGLYRLRNDSGEFSDPFAFGKP